MASRIFETILSRSIGEFVGCFLDDATKLFKDEKEKLINPGEYGRYREEACKNILRLLLDKCVGIDEGFVFTSTNQITTQCDVIVYNSVIAPIIAEGVSRMFPAEEVRMIGEIKSSLSKNEFIQALRKLAENKKIIVEGRVKNIKENINENEASNTIGSFLVCSKLDFDYDRLSMDEIYENIDRKYWHNGVLSVEDVFLSYALDFSKAPECVKEKLVENGYSMEKLINWSYSYLEIKGCKIVCPPNYVHANSDDGYRHIINFFICMTAVNNEVWIYKYEPAVYLGYCVGNIFEH